MLKLHGLGQTLVTSCMTAEQRTEIRLETPAAWLCINGAIKAVLGCKVDARDTSYQSQPGVQWQFARWPAALLITWSHHFRVADEL
jgi:hypothetical protein